MTVTGGVAGRHRVLGVLAERARTGRRGDGERVALAIEGGGMRGTVSAGMAMAVDELGLTPLFDAVYGASAGAISGAWLLSSRPEGLRGWTDPTFARALIRRRNVVFGRPLVNVERLVEVHYTRDFPLDFASILANEVEYHPIATDVVTGAAVDLHSRVTDAATLRLALRASAALPMLAGGPVRVGDGVYYDAGLAESIPYRRALADGATHVLVLRSRRRSDGAVAGGPSRGTRVVAGLGLRRYGPELRTTFLGRNDRLAADDRLLAEHDADAVRSGPAILSVRPPDSAPYVGRLERDGALLEAAFEAGRAAAAASLAGLAGDLAREAGG
ncbi:patatin-like phospholipase family protein [Actinomadura sediminis]|uniref:Patatin family protein n=1 Tax=Actinomadura sediminis TaxID=1038904 RepID=A0ABW3ENA2_9ACTN